MGIGFLELVIIGVAALVLLGPQKIPELLRQVARIYVQIRRASNDFKSAFDHVVHEAEDELKRNTGIPTTKKVLDQIVSSVAESTGHGAAPDNGVTDTSVTTPPNSRPIEPFSWGDAPIGQKSPPTDSRG